MKETELMIGDWVCYSKPNGYVARVEDISRYGNESLGYEYAVVCKRDKRDPLCEKNPFDLFNVEIIHPVELTSEILEANGFEHHAEEKGLYGVTISPYYAIEDLPHVFCDGDPFAVWFENEVPIKYVHQLQHVIRLCESEKEILLKEDQL